MLRARQIETIRTLVGRGHALEALEGTLLQCLAMVWVGDLDESMGTLAVILAKEVGDAILRYDVVSVGSGGDHRSARLEIDGNLRLALVGNRRHRQDGLAQAIESLGGATQKVHLSTEACEGTNETNM